MAVHPILTSFSGGEVSEALSTRIDIEKYNTFLAKCRNMIVLPQGGVMNRPGTLHARTTYGNPPVSRLVPFVYSKDQSYILDFAPGVITFYAISNDVAGRVSYLGGVPVTVTTTFTESRIWEATFLQSGDKLYIFHPT